MSKRRNAPPKMRGPSRPIDPRYAPGRPARRGPDPFGMALIGISMVAAIVVILFLAAQRGSTPATTTLDPAAAATQTSAAFNAQAATVAHITVQDAIAQHQSNSARFIDVRPAPDYEKQHIKGATSLPYTEAPQRYTEIPKEGNIILYCQ